MLVVFLLFVVVGYVIYVIQTAPLAELHSVIPKDGNKESQEFVLEEGAIANKEELETYFSFSEPLQEPQRYLKKLINEETLIEEEGNILFLKDLNIKSISKNHCSRVYCYQHRLSFENIPGYLWKGLIGIEDKRFLDHKGVDYISLARALVHDIRVMRFEQGGSTLTQQLIKNLFYTNEKKISRKIKEFILSYYVESTYEKENILEAYFNEVFWGSMQGIRIKGIYAASLFYFNKPVSVISPYEAAILIGMLKGPYYYSPFKYSERLKKRTKVVYNKLIELNLFPKDSFYQWTEKDWESWLTQLKLRSNQKELKSIWFASINLNKNLNDFEKFVLTKKSEEVLVRIKEGNEKADLAIKVLKFNLEKPLERYEYYSKYEKSLDKALYKEKHQIGSTIKPILYKIFTSLGKSLDDSTDTKPITLKLISGVWKPKESKKNADKEVTLREALMVSMNRPIIRISQEIGFDKIEEELQKFIPEIKTPLKEYPSQLLGAVELSLHELGEVYSRFLVSECYEEGGEVLKTLIDPTTTTIRYRVNKKLRNLEFFGKTGTSNNGLDNWFVAFDGSDVTIIWTGHEGQRDIKDLKLYGGSTSFEIFNNFYKDRGKRFSSLACQTMANASPQE
ncbi:MAG: hypothetical protein GY909_11450 [Oligoflexia bacterium]|nr:hypothetical protein [Oligoflexia bacterium]